MVQPNIFTSYNLKVIRSRKIKAQPHLASVRMPHGFGGNSMKLFAHNRSPQTAQTAHGGSAGRKRNRVSATSPTIGGRSRANLCNAAPATAVRYATDTIF